MQANEIILGQLMDYINIIQEHRAPVAHAAGVSVQTLQGWTEGEGEPTMEQANKILEFLRQKELDKG